MKIYLQALDYKIWEVVCDSPFVLTTKNKKKKEEIPKPWYEWNESMKK